MIPIAVELKCKTKAMYEFIVNHKMWDITNYLNCVFDFYQESLIRLILIIAD